MGFGIIGVVGASYAAGSAIGGGLSQLYGCNEDTQRYSRLGVGVVTAVGGVALIGASVAAAPAIIGVAAVVGGVAATGSIAYKIWQDTAKWDEVIQIAGTELNAFSNIDAGGAHHLIGEELNQAVRKAEDLWHGAEGLWNQVFHNNEHLENPEAVKAEAKAEAGVAAPQDGDKDGD
jgi:hypothetical protein